MRIVFMGTPDFAVPTLGEIVGAGHDVAAVYTQPPRPAGRGMRERPSPVEDFARAHGLDVMTPKSLKETDAQATFAVHEADVAVVVAYGLILPKPVLDAPHLGCFNLHASLLPRWRGAAPIQRAVMAGDADTGVCVMRMAEGLDTGPVCLSERVAIGANTSAGELHDQLAAVGGSLVGRALSALGRDTLACADQPATGVTYAEKIDKAEARIDWSAPASRVHDHIRGLSPFPGAWFELGRNGKTERVKVLRSEHAEGAGAPGTVLDGALTIACGEAAVRLHQVQRSGKAAMSAEDFLRGIPVAIGTVLD
jgi:methionyl-tRNA formyltransferase